MMSPRGGPPGHLGVEGKTPGPQPGEWSLGGRSPTPHEGQGPEVDPPWGN